MLTGLPSIYTAGSLEVVGPNGIAFAPSGAPVMTIGAGVDPTVRATDLAPVGTNLSRLLTFGSSVDLGATKPSTTRPAARSTPTRGMSPPLPAATS